ncbi:MAG: hypothetical protein GXY77_14205 [Fibrobacter sp.]|nr:hypothetical protein [Fibrobacter sp.]
MKNIFFVIVVIFSSIFFGCVDKNVSCNSRLWLTVINTLPDSVRVVLSDSSEERYGIKVSIKINDSLFVIQPGENKTNFIDYSWSSLNTCAFFNGGDTIAYRVFLKSFIGDSLLLGKAVFPYDLSISYKEICVDCLHEYYDTLIIK